MKPKIFLTVIVSLGLLPGCVSVYKPPAGKAHSKISFDLNNDSVGTTVRTFSIWNYSDSKCTPSKDGLKIDFKPFASEHEKLGPYEILGDSPFTFAVAYGEARVAQNRDCSVTATFTPSSLKKYTVHFFVKDQSYRCGIKILDEKENIVPFEQPEYTCRESLARKKPKNGGAGILTWEYRPY